MNDDMKLDARVRSALAELPAPDQEQTSDALRNVLRHGHAERVQPRLLGPTLVAAAVVVILALVGAVIQLSPHGQIQPAPSPDEVLGTWHRDVTSAGQPGWDGTWSISFDRNGVLVMDGPASAGASTEGASYALADDTVRVDAFVNNVCSELPAGTYSWSLIGDVMRLRLVQDPCPARIDLFAGSWRRP